MTSTLIYRHSRPAAFPAPADTVVTVEARVHGGAVGITWERDDLKAAGVPPTTLALRLEEFAGIVDALEAAK